MRVLAAFFLFLFLFITPVKAADSPLAVSNNKYGIHVADVNELIEVADLVNSNGGDWGYVTLVIQADDRDINKWRSVFDQLRRLHLIPLVRLATHVEKDYWLEAKPDQTSAWAKFLDQLNWPIKNRYVILFNEPNHSKEWNGRLDPEAYAEVLVAFSQKLKETSGDFFILPAGLDFSAASDRQSMAATQFLKRVIKAKPEFCELIDGWTSHSYPNPGFSAQPTQVGLGSLQGFKQELALLKQLGCSQNLPVFITETGWQHSEGKRKNRNLLSPETVANYIQQASKGAWLDQQVVAITPFIFSYQGEPFDHFSWKKLGVDDYYSHYYAYQDISKDKGRPKQEEKYTVQQSFLPPTLVAESVYQLSGELENLGQAILDSQDGYELVVDDKDGEFSVLINPLPYLEPGQKGEFSFHLKTPKKPGVYSLEVKLKHYDEVEILLERRQITVVPPPSLSLTMVLGWRKNSQAESVKVLIYDQKQTVVYHFDNQKLKNGQLDLERLFNIIPGQEYRVVGLVPYYLPRQKIVVLKEQENEIALPRFLPLDFNQDGRLSIGDYFSSFKLKPSELRRLFF